MVNWTTWIPNNSHIWTQAGKSWLNLSSRFGSQPSGHKGLAYFYTLVNWKSSWEKLCTKGSVRKRWGSKLWHFTKLIPREALTGSFSLPRHLTLIRTIFHHTFSSEFFFFIILTILSRPSQIWKARAPETKYQLHHCKSHRLRPRTQLFQTAPTAAREMKGSVWGKNKNQHIMHTEKWKHQMLNRAFKARIQWMLMLCYGCIYYRQIVDS